MTETTRGSIATIVGSCARAIAMVFGLACLATQAAQAQKMPEPDPMGLQHDIQDLVPPPCGSFVVRVCNPPLAAPVALLGGKDGASPWSRRPAPFTRFLANVLAGAADEQRSFSYAPGAARGPAQSDRALLKQVVDLSLIGLMGPAPDGLTPFRTCGPGSRADSCKRP